MNNIDNEKLRHNYLYIANIESFDDHSFSLAYNNTSLDRKKKADLYIKKDDRELCIGGEVLLKKILSDLKIETSIKYDYYANGKPHLINSEFDFNISHSGKYVVCALSKTKIGVDIEKIVDADLTISSKFFCKNESDDIKKTFDSNKRFYEYWCLKESFMKNTGLGFNIDLKQIEFKINKDITIKQNINTNNYYFYLGYLDNYVYSICCLKKRDFIIKNIDFDVNLIRTL